MRANFAGSPGHPAFLLTHEPLTNMFIILYLSIVSPGKLVHYVFHSFLKYQGPFSTCVSLLFLVRHPQLSWTSLDQPGPALLWAPLAPDIRVACGSHPFVLHCDYLPTHLTCVLFQTLGSKHVQSVPAEPSLMPACTRGRSMSISRPDKFVLRSLRGLQVPHCSFTGHAFQRHVL